MVGNEDSRLRLYRWLQGWTPGTKPTLLLGPPGTGKTTSAYLLGKELGYRVAGINASDVRTKKALEEKLGPLLENKGLFGESFLLFLDEVDGLHGRTDFGGGEFINDLIKESKYPLTMAANAEDVDVIRSLAKRSEIIRFYPLSHRQKELYLRRILAREEVVVDENLFSQVISKSRGDMRAAINSVQHLPELKGNKKESVPVRDQELSLRELIEKLGPTKDCEEIRSLLRRCTEHSPVVKLRTIYRGVTSGKMDESLRIDVLQQLADLDGLTFQSEFQRKFGLRRYFDTLLARTIFPIRTQIRYHEYDEIPWPVLQRIWNHGRVFRKVANKMGRLSVCSTRKTMAYSLPYFVFEFGNDKKRAEDIAKALEFDEGDVKVFEKESQSLRKR
tara:strand:+ start:2365 stop:3531 length:1167 start_codon:yes stop_codon:yes gene_type:complete